MENKKILILSSPYAEAMRAGAKAMERLREVNHCNIKPDGWYRTFEKQNKRKNFNKRG